MTEPIDLDKLEFALSHYTLEGKNIIRCTYEEVQVFATLIGKAARAYLAEQRQTGDNAAALDDKEKCYWDNLSPDDRIKPMGISCPCRKCSPFTLSQTESP